MEPEVGNQPSGQNEGGEPPQPLAAPEGQPGGPPQVPPGYVSQDQIAYRIRGFTDQITALQEQLDEARQGSAEATFLKRQLAALMGGGGKAPDPRTEAIRQELFDRVPELKWFVENRDGLARAMEEFPSVREGGNAYYQGYAQQTLSRLWGLAADEYGEELHPGTRRGLKGALTVFLRENPELHDRYEAGDLGVVDEFWEDYKLSHIEPLRRGYNRAPGSPGNGAPRSGQPTRPLPRGGAGGARATPSKPIDKMSMDELLDEAWTAHRAQGALNE